MVPAAVLISFLLLGVEEIGVQIEEPFGILPLGRHHSSLMLELVCIMINGACVCGCLCLLWCVSVYVLGCVSVSV